MFTLKDVASVLEFLQKAPAGHPAWFAFVIALILISITIYLSNIESSLLGLLLTITILGGAVLLALFLWKDAHEKDDKKYRAAVTSCVNSYNAKRDPQLLVNCVSSIENPLTRQDSDRISSGFLLNLSTAFAAEAIYLFAFIVLFSNRPLSLAAVAILAIAIPFLVECTQPYDDFFLNLGPEFLGLFVGKLILDKQKDSNTVV